MQYHELINKLYEVNLFGGMKLGLSNCLTLNAAMGFPSDSFQSIHVAGTNGKGSVTKKIACALEHEGYRVGLYISPHISCFRERISVNGFMIPEKAVESILSHLFVLADQMSVKPSFFEFATLMAFQYFAEEKVDFSVIEVGLGGRLDATNIVTPKLSVITSISLEHTEILGSTVEEIAQEKGGIIKPNVPFVLGPKTPQRIFHQIAKEQSSPCIQVDGDFNTYEEENCAIAKTALNYLGISENAVVKGLAAKLPCRFEIYSKKQFPQYNRFPETIIFDVAHNPDGLTSLFKAIKQLFPNEHLRILFGLSKTKDIKACLAIIKNNASHFHLVEAPNGRGAKIQDLYNLLVSANVPKENLFCSPTIRENFKFALEKAHAEKQLLIICGTFFIMSEIRNELGINEPRDITDMNER